MLLWVLNHFEGILPTGMQSDYFLWKW